ncbi:MAG: hypothetical protein AAGI48_00950 [Verrucomicrobiota bacterium]
MRSIFSVLAILLLSSRVEATEDALELVPLPLDTLQVEIKVVEVPFVIGKSLPESAFSAIGHPFAPPAISFHEHEDINVASVAGITVNPTHVEGRNYVIELDYSDVGKEYLTEELLEAVVECVHRVAGEGEDAYEVDLKLVNLDGKSPLHQVLKRLVDERGS